MERQILEKIKQTFDDKGFDGNIIEVERSKYILIVKKELEFGIEVSIDFKDDDKIMINFPSSRKTPEQAFKFRKLYEDAMDCLSITLKDLDKKGK